jgi:solute carrier family 27 fatty acid transporter 1/4
MLFESHERQMFAMYASHYVIGLSSDDVIYCHLPLYHSSGGQVATCSSLLFGTKTVIRKKFSATAFWTDCVTHGVTVYHMNSALRFHFVNS